MTQPPQIPQIPPSLQRRPPSPPDASGDPDEPDPDEPDEPAGRVDGRAQRRAQNIAVVVDAMLALLASGNPWPSVADVAARAGLSERSLYRYFDDMDGLARAAVETQTKRADHLYQPLPADGSLDERIDRLVAHRVQMHEQVGPIVQAARARALLHAPVAAGLAIRRQQLRDQLQALFAGEVEGRSDLLLALEVATGLDAVHALRTDRGCSAARTRRILRRTVAALLADAPGMTS